LSDDFPFQTTQHGFHFPPKRIGKPSGSRIEELSNLPPGLAGGRHADQARDRAPCTATPHLLGEAPSGVYGLQQ
ncbi:Uncharacterized protein FKW44_024912, partial [Caligus rogercresseyi]